MIIRGHSPAPTNESIQIATAIILKMCKLTANKEIAPIKAHTINDSFPSKDLSFIKKLVNCEIAFNADCYQIDFNNEELVKPLLSHCPEMTNELDKTMIKQLNSYHSTPYSSKAIKIILSIIGSGTVRQQQVANAMLMTPKKLQRKLAKEQTNFSSLLQQAREKLAKTYLQDHQYSVKKTGFLLGYMDETSFTKAFKGWTGETPTDFLHHATEL
ncbi:hypothetical protein BST96_00310 [Oceanicoccus sagamiensis]|uniref:HTH araC/xylS-type domain-containing protein n=1 Tax=Oceanicoccus sagamiensis TaxID=716816 RepID=A0A1X9N3A0_9GAMM|nr:hypothetical protein BST96_00310 [Oceanicoccus sagamiensis]